MTEPRITVTANGPYLVAGDIPLRRRAPITSEHGEPLTWSTGTEIEAKDRYALCRCGQSDNKPFCDGTHARVDFDGTETAPTDRYDDRSKAYPGTGIVVHDDRGICEHAGFCGNRVSNVWKMSAKTDDTLVRGQVMAMIERCPSGALTYEVDGEPVEPVLPIEVDVVTDGPLWVTGGVPIERADGQPIENRNRVTLCRCGASGNKPLCDGSHAEVGFRG
jgi:CDGSH-type Zn-finger protein